MLLDRRQFLLTTAAAALPVKLFAQPAGSGSPQLAKLFDTLFFEQLRQNPESATLIGLDKGPNADLRAKLSGADDGARSAAKALTASQLARLNAFPRTGLSDTDRLNLDVVTYTRRSAAEVQKFNFGGNAFGPSPYVVSQLTGAYQSVPDFLDTKHPIETREDADAYLSRMTAFAKRLDDETARMKHDAGLGVIPPDFILDLTIKQMQALQVPAAETVVVKSIAR